jgi:hypothetical protein
MSLILSHDELFAFAEQERELYEDLLKAFVGVPTVSSEPDRQRDIKRGVELAKETIGSFGGKVGVHRRQRFINLVSFHPTELTPLRTSFLFKNAE